MREMRRSKQQLSQEECIAILERNSAGVLSLLGEDGFPYGVPLSYAYHDHKIIFHGAKSGHKIDAIKHHDKASFCVIDKDEVNAEKFTTHYQSVIAFGKVSIVENEEDKILILRELSKKYSPHFMKEAEKEIRSSLPYVCIFVLSIENITGKKAKELLK